MRKTTENLKIFTNMTPIARVREPTNYALHQSRSNEHIFLDGDRLPRRAIRAAAATHAFQISLILRPWRRDCHAPLAALFSTRKLTIKTLSPIRMLTRNKAWLRRRVPTASGSLSRRFNRTSRIKS